MWRVGGGAGAGPAPTARQGANNGEQRGNNPPDCPNAQLGLGASRKASTTGPIPPLLAAAAAAHWSQALSWPAAWFSAFAGCCATVQKKFQLHSHSPEAATTPAMRVVFLLALAALAAADAGYGYPSNPW